MSVIFFLDIDTSEFPMDDKVKNNLANKVIQIIYDFI